MERMKLAKISIAFLTVLSVAIAVHSAGDNGIQGTIESVWNSSQGLQADITVQNNTDSTIYLDSILSPYSYYMTTQRDSILGSFSGGGHLSVRSHGKKIDIKRMLKIFPKDSHNFSILIDGTSQVILGNIDFEFIFSCYNKSEQEIYRIKLKRSISVR